MVVWVYAGGGDAEVGGFVPFLQQHLNCVFERRTPRPKPGPRPGVSIYHGLTGTSFIAEMRLDLQKYWDGTAGAILVLDDTDQNAPAEHETLLRQAVIEILRPEGGAVSTDTLPIVIALAVPELEMWLLADWDNTFKKAFKSCYGAVQHELSSVNKVDFSAPENFSVFNEAGEYQKISQIIKDLIWHKSGKAVRYSKATDTPRLLQIIDPNIVKGKCPYFRSFWNAITKLCP